MDSQETGRIEPRLQQPQTPRRTLANQSIIGSSVTAEDNTTVAILWKGSMWIRDVPFPIVDESWQYMLAIPDVERKVEVASHIGHPPSMVS